MCQVVFRNEDIFCMTSIPRDFGPAVHLVTHLVTRSRFHRWSQPTLEKSNPMICGNWGIKSARTPLRKSQSRGLTDVATTLQTTPVASATGFLTSLSFAEARSQYPSICSAFIIFLTWLGCTHRSSTAHAQCISRWQKYQLALRGEQ